MPYSKDREAFIARIVSEASNNDADTRPADERPSFGQRADLARAILRDATTHNRCAERECSEDMSEREAARVEKQSAACERRITERLALLGPGFSVAEFTGDPRGATVKIRVPSGYGDSWGDRTMFCVPVRG